MNEMGSLQMMHEGNEEKKRTWDVTRVKRFN